MNILIVLALLEMFRSCLPRKLQRLCLPRAQFASRPFPAKNLRIVPSFVILDGSCFPQRLLSVVPSCSIARVGRAFPTHDVLIVPSSTTVLVVPAPPICTGRAFLSYNVQVAPSSSALCRSHLPRLRLTERAFLSWNTWIAPSSLG